MRDHKMTERPVMHWVPVVDDRGRTHMEARWTVEAQASTRQQAPRSLSAALRRCSRAAVPDGTAALVRPGTGHDGPMTPLRLRSPCSTSTR